MAMIYDDPMGEENREDLLRFLENKKSYTQKVWK